MSHTNYLDNHFFTERRPPTVEFIPFFTLLLGTATLIYFIISKTIKSFNDEYEARFDPADTQEEDDEITDPDHLSEVTCENSTSGDPTVIGESYNLSAIN